MKTDLKVLSSFLAAAVWADGEYDEFEQEFVGDLADDLELSGLPAALAQEIKITEKMDENALDAYLQDAAKKVASGEKEGILSICLQLMCADAFLAIDEVENFFAFADLLGVDEDAASEILDEFVEDEEDLIIEE